jgi:hypothetical protein
LLLPTPGVTAYALEVVSPPLAQVVSLAVFLVAPSQSLVPAPLSVVALEVLAAVSLAAL